MSEDPIGRPPRSFWIVSSIALLWNFVGVMGYLGHVTTTDEALAALPEAERMLYLGTPSWVVAAFAIAVFAGMLGCLLLLGRRTLAVPVLMLSLAAIVVQMFHNFFMSDAVNVMGAPAVALPVLVIVIAVFLLWYAQTAKNKGWLR